MIRSAVTVSLVEEARGGPFVFWDDLAAACQRAAELGFDAVEIFAPGPAAVDPQLLNQLLNSHGLRVAAVGSGAGMVKHGLSLTDPRAEQRTAAQQFLRGMIEFGARYGAPTIIGSMQGRWGGALDREAALALLRDALNDLGEYANRQGVRLLYEPLNRYETNLITTLADGELLLQMLSTDNVRLLADLFHMNLEETNLAEALRQTEGSIGHVHFVDSNRRAAGLGHTDFGPIAAALHAIHYEGYLSAEALPYPDSDTAARCTIDAFRRHFG
jgi:sugar phosphate isomerase/epimerase